jgi:hypothetical protein
LAGDIPSLVAALPRRVDDVHFSCLSPLFISLSDEVQKNPSVALFKKGCWSRAGRRYRRAVSVQNISTRWARYPLYNLLKPDDS